MPWMYFVGNGFHSTRSSVELRFRAVTFGGAPSGTKRTYVSIGLASTLSVVYFVSNSLLGIQRPKKL